MSFLHTEVMCFLIVLPKLWQILSGLRDDLFSYVFVILVEFLVLKQRVVWTHRIPRFAHGI